MAGAYLNIGTEICGPYTEEEFQELFNTGQVTAETLCKVEGNGLGWLPAWKYGFGKEQPNPDDSDNQPEEADLATELQKEKLLFFGCTFDDGISKRQASEALDYCAANFPTKESEWQAKPPTPEQIERLERLGLDTEGINFSEAYKILNDPLLEAKELMEYMESDEGVIDEEVDRINFDWAEDYREVTRDEVTKAWALVKSRGTERPSTTQLLDALAELFSDFRFQKREHYLSKYHLNLLCHQCEAVIKIPILDLGDQPLICPRCRHRIG